MAKRKRKSAATGIHDGRPAKMPSSTSQSSALLDIPPTIIDPYSEYKEEVTKFPTIEVLNSANAVVVAIPLRWMTNLNSKDLPNDIPRGYGFVKLLALQSTEEQTAVLYRDDGGSLSPVEADDELAAGTYRMILPGEIGPFSCYPSPCLVLTVETGQMTQKGHADSCELAHGSWRMNLMTSTQNDRPGFTGRRGDVSQNNGQDRWTGERTTSCLIE
jgi:hypothetical protein